MLSPFCVIYAEDIHLCGQKIEKNPLPCPTGLQAKLVDGLIETDPSAAEIDDARLQGFARQLVETLHDIAKIARKERKRRIVKKTLNFICAVIVAVVVAVIAAMVAEIFGEFGWLEQIKAFIYNILQLE